MELGLAEWQDIERFLGTLTTCDYMGIPPKLNDTDYFVARCLEVKIRKFVEANS